MPSTAKSLPLGLKRTSAEGSPAKSTYCVAICPRFASSSSHSGVAINLPSPWDMGTFITSPTFTRESHGERLEHTRVRTILDWWRAMVL